MLNQSFSARNLKRLIKRKDFYQFALDKDPEVRHKELEAIAAATEDAGFQFEQFRHHSFTHGRAVYPVSFRDTILIRKLNDNLKRVFSIQAQDRNRILPQIRSLLRETGEFWFQKLDIKKFYENIDREKLLRSVCDDPRISYETRNMLTKLFNSHSLPQLKGLPRGLSISSTLSELCMLEFDQFCRTHPQVYFYARYVDDIILLFHQDPGDVLSKFAPRLPDNLSFNEAKCVSFHREAKGPTLVPLNAKVAYLGYEFGYPAPKKSGEASPLVVSISDKKILRIKRRICLALNDFVKSGNLLNLQMRLSFLTSNFRVGSDLEQGNLYGGVYFGNSLIDDKDLKKLCELDDFLRAKVLGRKGWLGARLDKRLTRSQRRSLIKYSFRAGYEKKIVKNFDPKMLAEITGVWRYA